MKKILLLLSIVLVSLTSCNNDKSENVLTTTIRMATQSNRSGDVEMTSNNYNITVDFGEYSGTFIIDKLSIPGEYTLSNLTFSVPFSISSTNAYVFKKETVEAKAGMETYTLTDFNANLTVNGYAVSFKIDDVEFTSLSTVQSYVYTSTSVTSETTEPYVGTSSEYVFNMDPTTSTADLYIFNAQFASDMPQLDMVFKGLEMKASDNGIFSITSEGITPEVNSTPYPKYEISDFNAVVNSESCVISFKCAGTYTVIANCKLEK